jgi:GntR family transcriptional regulator / MocR family aminotransferase
MQYRDIAERLGREIMASGKPGDRLPGVRELAEQEGISLVTARNVYALLKEKGILVVRQGSGTFVRAFGDRGYVDMASIGPPDELLLWVGPHLKLPLEGLSEYDPPEGYAPLRERAGQWLEESGVEGLPLVTSGSQQALFLAGLALLKPGDLVAVETPCYRGAVRIFESLGAKVLPIPYLTGKGALGALKNQRIRLFYTMPQGHFPTGLSIPGSVRPALLSLAEKNGFYIIEDDPVSELVGVPPLKAQDKVSRVIYTKSLSNILGPGLRIGFSLFPEPLLDRIVRLKEINDLSISSMVQRMLHELMMSKDFPAYLGKAKALLEARQGRVSALTGAGVEGVCLWIKTPEPGRIHAERLLQSGIRVTSGDIYGPEWAHHIRVSLLRPASARFEQAVGAVLRDVSGDRDTRLRDLL